MTERRPATAPTSGGAELDRTTAVEDQTTVVEEEPARATTPAGSRPRRQRRWDADLIGVIALAVIAGLCVIGLFVLGIVSNSLPTEEGEAEEQIAAPFEEPLTEEQLVNSLVQNTADAASSAQTLGLLGLIATGLVAAATAAIGAIAGLLAGARIAGSETEDRAADRKRREPDHPPVT